RLLIDFADDLCRSGLRPVGVIQSGRSCRAENPRLSVIMLPGGETAGLVADMEDCGTGGCRLDDRRLGEIAKRLATAIADGARPLRSELFCWGGGGGGGGGE